MNTIFYGMFVFLWGITKGIDIGMPHWLSTICVVLGGISWLLKMGMSRYSNKEVYINVVLLLGGIISYCVIHRMGVLVAVMVVIGAKGVNYKQVLKILLLLQIILMVSRIVPELIRVFQGDGWSGLYQSRKLIGVFGGAEQYRMSFGFYHPNEFHRAVFTITALVTCIWYENLKNWQLIVLFFINVLAYAFTFSNTALAVGLFFFMVVSGLKKQINIIKWICKYSRFIFLFTMTFTILICMIYSQDNKLTEMINSLLTGRVRWAHEYIGAVQLSLLGRDIENVQVPYKGLDCGYVHILLRYGTLILVMYGVAVYQLFRKMFVQGLYVEIILLMCFHFYFVMENFIFISFQNITWVFLGNIFLNSFNKIEVS